MGIRTWRLRLWWKRALRRIWWRLQSEVPPLREFVYVDEVSIYSLMSSRVGALPTEFTETQTAATKLSNTASLGVERLPLTLAMSSAQEDSSSSSSQVIKKSTVQTTFREFYSYERPRLILTPSDVVNQGKRRPTLHDLRDLEAAADADLDSTWVVGTDSLQRGRLFEVDVKLSTNRLFKFSTIFSTLADIISDTPELFPGVLDAQFGTARSVNRVLNRLLVGLIPLEATVIDYFVIQGDAREYVVHASMLPEPALASMPTRPLIVAGVTEQGLYWRDIRRILFAERTFRIFGRIAETGLVETWRPVKLAEVLTDAVPNLTRDLDQGARTALAAFGTTDSPNNSAGDEEERVEQALGIYAERLGREVGAKNNASVLPVWPRPLEGYGSMVDINSRRAAFAPVTDWYAENYDTTALGANRVAQLRTEALAEAGFDERGRLVPVGEVDMPQPPNSDNASLLLESEIVAIYW